MVKKKNNLERLRLSLKNKSSKKVAIVNKSFFKTKPGQYSENDIFIGLKVPEIRLIAKEFTDLSLVDLSYLLKSGIHEERFCALVILIKRFSKDKTRVFRFYCRHLNFVNNWDLVDLSAPIIVGQYLLDKDRDFLYKLIKSKNLWYRRIAIVSTLTFIKNNDFKDIFSLAKMIFLDNEDLIHKATGWMLREVGKRDIFLLESFLDQNYLKMPRTTVRYSIEHFSKIKRKKYFMIK